MALVAVAGQTGIEHKRPGAVPGCLTDIAHVAGVKLQPPRREGDRTLLRWQQQVVEGRDRAIVEVRSGGPDAVEGPGFVRQQVRARVCVRRGSVIALLGVFSCPLALALAIAARADAG